MPLNVTKDCFPASKTCHNCARKRTYEHKKENDPKEDSKRCANCHMMTYCDKDCQKEHWIRVHKKHCRFLSGKVIVNGFKHNSATCVKCIHGRESSPTQIRSEKSPETICDVEEVDIAMKLILNAAFNFHGEGKKCNCSLKHAFELPFPLGEVTGQYIEVASTGLDAMLAHALKILSAMTVKSNQEDHKDTLGELWTNIIHERSQLWSDIIIHGVPIGRSIKPLSDQVDSLQTLYGASNAWWKTLKFTVDFAVKTTQYLSSNFTDSQSLEDPRFPMLKLLHDYDQSQLKNQAMVTEKKAWSTFKLWPGIVNGKLGVSLSTGTRCQICYDELCGEVVVTPHEVHNHALPILFPDVGENGTLMTFCSIAKNPNCWKDFFSKCRMRSDENRLQYLKEHKLFSIESRECDFCAKSSLSSHRCSACLTVQYCSTICQKKDLDFHTTVCSSWATNESRKLHDKKKQKVYKKSAVASWDQQ